MIPQEKAKELVNKYLQVYDGRLPIAKQCALIAVDEIIKDKKIFNQISVDYWQDVAQQIKKL
jgi:hypothetical protein